MKELIGHKVLHIHVNEDQSIIRFTDDEGSAIHYYAEGDCCSESWFADILMSSNFFNVTVTEVIEIEVPDWVQHLANSDGRGRQEEDSVYGYQIKTERASSGYYINSQWCDIIFRNSSNGYYGGSCELMDIGKEWCRKKLEECVWEQITEDWKA